MAIATEYSRLVWKRSTETGVEPTIPTATTIDNTWLDTDLLIGEGFLNTADDKFWFRTDNGLVELSLSGISSDNYYTDAAYLSGNTIVFDRTDTEEAYAVDLSPVLSGLTGDYLPLDITENTVINYSGFSVTLSGDPGGASVGHAWEYAADYSSNYTDRSLVDKAYVDANGGGTFTGGSITGDVTFETKALFKDDVEMQELSAITLSVLNSGATSRDYFDYSSNTIETDVTNSAIVAGSGNTIPSGLTNVFVSGVDLTADTDDTAYFSNIRVDSNIQGATSGLMTSPASDTNGVIISSNDCRINPSVVNSVVMASTGRTASANNTLYLENLDVNGSSVGIPYDYSFAVTDETTAITSGSSLVALYAPRDFAIEKVKVSLSTSGSSTTTVDVNVGGSSILTSPIDLASGVFVNSTTSLSTSDIHEDDRITVDIDAAGSEGKGLKVYLIGKNR